MAVSFFEQIQPKPINSDLQSLSSGSGHSIMSNGSQGKPPESYQNGSVASSRAKSVNNIVKRSAGISDNYDDPDLNTYLSTRMNSDSASHNSDHLSSGNNYYNVRQDEYSASKFSALKTPQF